MELALGIEPRDEYRSFEVAAAARKSLCRDLGLPG